MTLPQVKPGELIAAENWNLLVQKVNDLDSAVATLLSTGVGRDPVITQILPLSPPAIWRSGDAIEIRGFNFGYSRGAQQVLFNGVMVTAFKSGSSDTSLLIDIPAIPGMPDSGQDVNLTIANGYGSVSRSMRILPVDIPITGAVIDVNWTSVSPNPITPGVPVFIGYQLRSRAPVTAMFTVTPAVLSPPGITGLGVYNSPTEENTSRQYQLAPLQTRNFLVRIPSIPVGTGSFSLEAEAAAGSALGSDARDFPLNQLIILPDTSIGLTPLQLEAINPNTALPDPAGGSYNPDDRTIRLLRTRVGQMSLRAEFQTAGNYRFQIVPIGLLGGWTIGIVGANPATPALMDITIDAGDFAGGATVVGETSMFSVTPPPAPSSAGAVVEFRVFRQGTSQGQIRRFNLALQV